MKAKRPTFADKKWDMLGAEIKKALAESFLLDLELSHARLPLRSAR